MHQFYSTGIQQLDDLLDGGLPREGMVYSHGLSYEGESLTPRLIKTLSDQTSVGLFKETEQPDSQPSVLVLPLDRSIGRHAERELITTAWAYARLHRKLVLVHDHPVMIARKFKGNPQGQEIEAAGEWALSGSPICVRMADIVIYHHNADRAIRVKFSKLRHSSCAGWGWRTLDS